MDIMSQRIYDRRKALEMTMEELGKKVGVAKSTISKWEKGYVDNIKSSNIASLAKALKVSPLWLMGEDENSSVETKIVGEVDNYIITKKKDEFRIYKIEDLEKCISNLDVDDLDRLSAFIDYQKVVKKQRALTIIPFFLSLISFAITFING